MFELGVVLLVLSIIVPVLIAICTWVYVTDRPASSFYRKCKLRRDDGPTPCWCCPGECDRATREEEEAALSLFLVDNPKLSENHWNTAWGELRADYQEGGPKKGLID